LGEKPLSDFETAVKAMTDLRKEVENKNVFIQYGLHSLLGNYPGKESVQHTVHGPSDSQILRQLTAWSKKMAETDKTDYFKNALAVLRLKRKDYKNQMTFAEVMKKRMAVDGFEAAVHAIYLRNKEEEQDLAEI
jgi:hypothetical protein